MADWGTAHEKLEQMITVEMNDEGTTIDENTEHHAHRSGHAIKIHMAKNTDMPRAIS